MNVTANQMPVPIPTYHHSGDNRARVALEVLSRRSHSVPIGKANEMLAKNGTSRSNIHHIIRLSFKCWEYSMSWSLSSADIPRSLALIDTYITGEYFESTTSPKYRHDQECTFPIEWIKPRMIAKKSVSAAHNVSYFFIGNQYEVFRQWFLQENL